MLKRESFCETALNRFGSLCSLCSGGMGVGRIECFLVGRMALGKQDDFQQLLNASGICVTHCVRVFLIDELARSEFYIGQGWQFVPVCLVTSQWRPMLLLFFFFLHHYSVVEIDRTFGKTFLFSLTASSAQKRRPGSFTTSRMCPRSICPRPPCVSVSARSLTVVFRRALGNFLSSEALVRVMELHYLSQTGLLSE